MADEKFNEDFFIEVLSSKLPDQAVNIRGIGRGNITQDISSLKLPKAVLAKEKENKSGAPPGRGRGEFRSLMSDRPARLPKNRDNYRSLIGIHNTNHFPSLHAESSKQSPSSSPKTSAKHTKSSNQHSSSPNDSDSSWPSLSASSESSKKSSDKLHSFAQACKGKTKTKNTNQPLLKSKTGSEIIIMRNLPEAILEEDLIELLQLYGNVLTCNIERNNQGNSLGCALISMETKAECDWIISCFHDQEYPGCTGLGKLTCTYLN